MGVDGLGASLDNLSLDSESWGEGDDKETILSVDMDQFALETGAVEISSPAFGMETEGITFGFDGLANAELSEESKEIGLSIETLDIEVGKISDIRIGNSSEKLDKVLGLLGLSDTEQGWEEGFDEASLELKYIHLHASGELKASFSEDETIVEGDFENISVAAGIDLSILKEDTSNGDELRLDASIGLGLSLGGEFKASFSKEGLDSADIRLEKIALEASGDVDFYKKDGSSGDETRLDAEFGLGLELGGALQMHYSEDEFELGEIHLEKIDLEADGDIDFYKKDVSSGEEISLKGNVGLALALEGSLKLLSSDDGGYSLEEARLDKTDLDLNLDIEFSKQNDAGDEMQLDTALNVEFSALGGPHFDKSDDKIEAGFDFSEVNLAVDGDINFFSKNAAGSELGLDANADLELSASKVNAALLFSNEDSSVDFSLEDVAVDALVNADFYSKDASSGKEVDLDLGLDLELLTEGRLDLGMSGDQKTVEFDFDKVDLDSSLNLSILNKDAPNGDEMRLDLAGDLDLSVEGLNAEAVFFEDQSSVGFAVDKFSMESRIDDLSYFKRDISHNDEVRVKLEGDFGFFAKNFSLESISSGEESSTGFAADELKVDSGIDLSYLSKDTSSGDEIRLNFAGELDALIEGVYVETVSSSSINQKATGVNFDKVDLRLAGQADFLNKNITAGEEVHLAFGGVFTLFSDGGSVVAIFFG